MKYKIGDKVVLKPALLLEELGVWGYILDEVKQGGRVGYIAKTDENMGYLIELPTSTWWIKEDYILGYYFEYGEEIEVSDGIEWNPAFFSAYDPHSSLKVVAWRDSCVLTYHHYYARPVQKEPECKLLKDFKVGDKVKIFGPTNASNPCEILFIGEEKVFCRDKNGGEYAFGLDWNSHLWQDRLKGKYNAKRNK